MVRKVYAVDLDGTLCEEDGWEKSKYAMPKLARVRALQKLFLKGAKVIIYTGRGEEMRTETEEWLELHSIPYHELHMGKPRADLYVDEAKKLLSIEELEKHDAEDTGQVQKAGIRR
jgi:uncharacterized HAD superfamily protein